MRPPEDPTPAREVRGDLSMPGDGGASTRALGDQAILCPKVGKESGAAGSSKLTVRPARVLLFSLGGTSDSTTVTAGTFGARFLSPPMTEALSTRCCLDRLLVLVLTFDTGDDLSSETAGRCVASALLITPLTDGQDSPHWQTRRVASISPIASFCSSMMLRNSSSCDREQNKRINHRSCACSWAIFKKSSLDVEKRITTWKRQKFWSSRCHTQSNF